MKNRIFLVACLLALAGLVLTYSNHFNNPFHFDDAHTIETNAAIRDIKNISRFFVDGTTSSSLPANQAYRPGLTTLNAIDFWLGGKDVPVPFYYHRSIFIVFVLLAIALFFFFLKIYNLAYEHKNNKWVALFTVTFFCYHTATAETINYIIQRAESFSTFMIILAFLIYFYLPKVHKFYLFIIPVLIGFTVKEPTIMFMPLLFLFIFLFEKEGSFTELLQKKGMQRFLKALLFTLPGIILCLVLFSYSRSKTPENWTSGGGDPIVYLQTQMFVIVHYVNNFFLPLNLSADTDWKPIVNPFDDRVIVGALFILTMIVLAFRASRNKESRPVAFGILWFFVALLPTSSVFAFAEVLNDHRPFFPYIGLVMAVVWACVLFIRKHQTAFNNPIVKILVPAFCLLLLTAHGIGAHHRNDVWSSGEKLWKDVTVKSPGNGRGWMNYGNSQMAKGNYPEALIAFNKAKDLWPYYSYVHINLGILHAATGKHSEAENYYKTAISLDAKNPETYRYYGKWLIDRQRYPEAQSTLQQGLKISPQHLEMQQFYNIAMQYTGGKNVRLENMLEQLKTNPTAEGYLNLSLEYYNLGDYQKCVEASEQSLKLKPDYELAYNNICSAYNAMKQYDNAIAACEKALQIKPDFELAKNNLKLAKTEKAKQN
ncbi:MAG: tetratricopeptide repeat protein [Bacteroidia bacterium]